MHNAQEESFDMDTVSQQKEERNARHLFLSNVSDTKKSLSILLHSVKNEPDSLRMEPDITQLAAALHFGVPELLRLSQLNATVPYEWSVSVRRNCLQKISPGSTAILDWDLSLPRLEQPMKTLAYIGPPTGWYLYMYPRHLKKSHTQRKILT